MGTLVTYSGVNDDGKGADEVGGGGDAYAATNEGGGWFGLHAFVGETREGQEFKRRVTAVRRLDRRVFEIGRRDG
jgi:hypothetical protein